MQTTICTDQAKRTKSIEIQVKLLLHQNNQLQILLTNKPLIKHKSKPLKISKLLPNLKVKNKLFVLAVLLLKTV